MSDNIDNRFMQHGGNLSFITHHFPDAPRPFIDLSTGITPYPYLLELGKEGGYRLADIREMAEVTKAAADYYGVKPENVNLAAGMQPLMFALAALRFQKFGVAKVMILSPTYSEYEILWRKAGHQVVNVNNIDDLTGADVAIICNPNNPDGKIYALEKLRSLQNNWLIIDEAFADIVANYNSLPERDGIIRMRSCGKFFGIAGLRVSAAIAQQEISGYLRAVLGSWAIATPVCLALPVMFADKVWIEKTRLQLFQESKNWREILSKYFRVVGYTSLFTLLEVSDADYYHGKLAEQGILVRKFSYNNSWLRFGLPDKKYLERVEAALK